MTTRRLAALLWGICLALVVGARILFERVMTAVSPRLGEVNQ